MTLEQSKTLSKESWLLWSLPFSKEDMHLRVSPGLIRNGSGTWQGCAGPHTKHSVVRNTEWGADTSSILSSVAVK